jgi:hypothetical protein
VTARRRVTLSYVEAEALAAERREIAMRSVVAAVADRFPREALHKLVGDLQKAGGADQLVRALRKRLRQTPRTPEIGGSPQPNPAVWNAQIEKTVPK